MVIPPGVMPSDGVTSISVDDPANPTGFVVGVNSPTNFAGQTGSVVLTPQVPLLPWSGWPVLLGLGLAGGWLAVRRARPQA
jgi:hypothetical protein